MKLQLKHSLACLICLVICQGFASADPVSFAVTNTGRFGSIDLGTGDFTFIGQGYPGRYDGLGNLADSTLVAVDRDNLFVQIDPTTGEVTAIGPTGIEVTACGSLLTGDQYAVDDQNELYQIDPDTGAATLVGPTGIPGVELGFNNALAGDATSLYYIYEQADPDPVPSTLFQLDLTTGAATEIGPTGTDRLVGAGFADGTLYAYQGRSGDRQIFSIDLDTGAATAVATYGPAIAIFGSNSGKVP
jgi:hypothetical protein